MMLCRLRALLLLLLVVAPLVLLGQSKPGNGFSNLRSARLPVSASDTIQIDTLSIERGSFHIADIPDSNYTLLPEHSLLIWKQHPDKDSVFATYRVLPILFTKEYYHKKPAKQQENGIFMEFTHRDYNLKKNKTSGNFVDYNPIEYNGSYGRSIALGNNQDVTLNSHFNLQVNGYLLDSIKLEAALTDNTIPFQPEGNTARLQEFDQIYIHLSKCSHDLMLGDYALEKPPGYFLNFYKRVQGLFYQTAFKVGEKTTNKMGLSGSIAKGQYARNIFQGEEGNQGPYKLTGNNGEQYFIVLAGTEKVYVNDQLVQRGENADYIINYNTAEVRFMPRMMITKDSRIQITFEYQDRNYLNSLIYAYDEIQVGKKWNVRANIYSNQDAKNQSYLQNLDGSQKTFLSRLGDSIQNAYYPVVNLDTFSESKILYRITDSTVDGTTYDSVFVYSTNSNLTLYSLSFSYVGEGLGNYVISGANANGRVYEWVAPVAGQSVGNYAPVQLLITPKQQQVVTINATYQIDSLKKLYVEVAGSNTDPNLFSSIDNGTHWGMAGKMNYTEARKLGQSGWSNETHASYEYVEDVFQGILPYRNVEFGRDWNVSQTNTDKPDEHLAYAGTRLNSPKAGSLQYDFGYYKRGSAYTGYKNILAYSYLGKSFRGGITGNLLTATDTFTNSKFYRPSAYAEYDIHQLGDITLGGSFSAEYDYITNNSTDTLSAAAFAFDVTTAYLKLPQTLHLPTTFNYTLRRDLLPRGSDLELQSHSHNFSLQSQLTHWRNHAISFTGTYRKLLIDDSSFNTQSAEESLLGRLAYNANLFKQAITLNTLYEFGAGQEQKRSYTYVEVAAGQGLYTWNDYNGDGVQQTNEFEIALYADQKKFIKVFSPTNEYVRVNYVTFNESISFEPARFYSAEDKGFGSTVFSRFSDQLSLQISNRLLSSEGLKVYNPFLSSLDNDAVISTANAVNNTVYFNRANAHWGADYNILYSNNKQLLTYGVEGSSTNKQQLRLRYNLNRAFTINTMGTKGYRAYNSALEDNRTYLVQHIGAEPSLTWIHQARIRITGSYKYEERKNAPAYGGEQATLNSVNIDLRWSNPTNGTIQLRGTYTGIQYTGETNTTVSFVMLDALQQGSNYLWYANWERRLSKGIEVSLEYEGRKPGTGTVIHTGRMSVRAIL